MKIKRKIYEKVKKNILSRMTGRRKWQSFFEEMHYVSLHGMNIGLGDNYIASGEKCVLEIISNKYKNNNEIIMFDVGANTGNYSKLVNDIFGNRVKIFAFEPIKSTFAKMSENTKDLKNIKRYNFGFGEITTKTKMYSNAKITGIASVYKRNLEHFNINIDKEEIVEIQTIDEFCVCEWGGGGYYSFPKIGCRGT